jgi:micrococcal nuclease
MVVLALALIFQLQEWGILDMGIPAATENTIGTYYEVTKVTDGDTLRIAMDGTDERVRLLGINTPETTDPRKNVECFGKEASARMKELADGKIVRLEYDDTQSLRDSYGRLLAYVYLEDGQMLNRKMVAEGYAYEYTYMAPYKYQAEFRELQNLAKASGRGLWSPDTCAGKK